MAAEEQTVRKSADGTETFLFFYGSNTIFSNFVMSDFTVDGVKFNCTEQYFHYKKAELFGDAEMQRQILASDKPRKHKALGRKVRNFDQDQWKAACKEIMKQGVLAKFQQNNDLRDELLKTKDWTLVEASPRDCIWGIGLGKDSPGAVDRSNWRGSNYLGTVLMEVRQQLLEQA